MLNISSILYNCMRNIMLIASIFCVYDTATLHLLTLYSPWWWTRNIFTFCLWLVVSKLNLHSRLAKSIVPRLDITVTQDDLGGVGWLYGPSPHTALFCPVLLCPQQCVLTKHRAREQVTKILYITSKWTNKKMGKVRVILNCSWFNENHDSQITCCRTTGSVNS